MGGFNPLGAKKNIIENDLIRKQLRYEIPDTTFSLLPDARTEVARENVQARRKALAQLRTINLSLFTFLLLLYYLAFFLRPDLSYLGNSTGYFIPLIFVLIVALAVFFPKLSNAREHKEAGHPPTSVEKLEKYARLEIEEEESKKRPLGHYRDLGEAVLLILLLSADTVLIYIVIYGLSLTLPGI